MADVQPGLKLLFTMTHIMAQPRLKTFEIPHKGLRNLLGQVSFLAGNTDFSDATQVARLHQLGRTLFQLLTEHARDEDEVLLAALEQRHPGATTANAEEHEMIEQEQAKLEQIFEELIAQARSGASVDALAEQFYLALNHFHSGYLMHMLGEEEETQRLLWKHFTDTELLELRGRIIARISPVSMLNWYRFAAPAMSHQGRLMWLKGAKAGAPAPFFTQIMETLEVVLPSADFQKLVLDLNGL